MKENRARGFGLVEIIVAVSLIVTGLVALMGTSALSHQVAGDATRELQAAFLLEEGVEAVKSLRDKSWQTYISPLVAGTGYYLSYVSIGSYNKWVLTTPSSVIDGVFTRKVQIGNVYRDANDDIAASGTLDVNTKQVTVTVSWQGRGGVTKTKTVSTYMTNLFSN